MAFSSCFCYPHFSLKNDCSGLTIRSHHIVGKDQKLFSSLRSNSIELLGQRVARVGADLHRDWNFLGGSRIIVHPKLTNFLVYRKSSGVNASWLTSSQIASSVFTLGTAAVLPFYTLMVVAPKAEVTRKSMESSIPFIVLGLLYAFLLYLSWTPDTMRLMFASQYWPDYVGSPLAEPVKRFPSLPVSQGSLSSLAFSRQHSWYFDHNKASPPSFSFSPSPNRSGKHGSISNPPEVPSVHEKNTSFDEDYPSPSYTPSPSPSPSICIPGSHLSTVVLQSESAPFSMPATKHASSPLLSNKQNLPPSPPLKATTSCNPKTDESTGLVHPRATDEKLFSPGKDDIRKYASVKTLSNSSPRISFSRTSSRPEKFDKTGHLSDPLEPGGLFPIKKSQDAAVGALVHSLKKPPPLCQDLSGSAVLPPDSRSKMWSCNLQEHNPISGAPAGQQVAASGVASSGLLASKTAADALEELKRYEEIKDSLLSQAGRSNA